MMSSQTNADALPYLALCNGCGQTNSPQHKLMRCGKCKSIGYCSKTCQKNDWKTHKAICSKMYFVHMSHKRPIRGGIGFGEKTIHGPFVKGVMQSFLHNNNLTTNRNHAHAQTIMDFVGPNGEQLMSGSEVVFDTRTGGFGGIVIKADASGNTYEGEGWNEPISPDQIVNLFRTGGGIQIHAWCIDKEGNVYDYDDDHLGKDVFFHSDQVVRVQATEGTTTFLMPFLKEAFDQWLAKSGKSVTQHMKKIKRGTFKDRQCWHRAMLLKMSDPTKYTTVLGSYGFHQPDGRNTFYVWG